MAAVIAQQCCENTLSSIATESSAWFGQVEALAKTNVVAIVRFNTTITKTIVPITRSGFLIRNGETILRTEIIDRRQLSLSQERDLLSSADEIGVSVSWLFDIAKVDLQAEFLTDENKTEAMVFLQDALSAKIELMGKAFDANNQIVHEFAWIKDV